MTAVYKDIKLTDLKPNPHNFRTQFDGPEFEQFVESIRQKGVLQPILVRPCKGKKKYEIVFGERRFRAAKIVSKDKKGRKTIPARVMELSGKEAFDLMVIENLQRENLTELEEAKGFKLYLDKNGLEALGELAERTGINAAFIRRRTMVLDLPKPVLDAWGRGEIRFGYLEQLARLDDEDEIMGCFENILEGCDFAFVKELKEYIDNQAIALEHAVFDLKLEGCVTCHSNSSVQIQLFAIDAEKAKCLKTDCFNKKQADWLTSNWKQSTFHKKFKTCGYRFSQDTDHRQRFIFHDKKFVGKQCHSCDAFVTLFSGPRLRVQYERTCIGDRRCFDKLFKSKEEKASSRTSGNAASDTRDGQDDKPRVAWHGEHFREEFFQKQIPQRFEGLSDRSLSVAQLSLFAFVKSNYELQRWFVGKFVAGKDEFVGYYEDPQIFEPISKMPIEQVSTVMKEAVLQVVLFSNFSACGRRVVADHLDIDLSKEWKITEAYLMKKRIPEIVGLGERFGIFKDEKAKAYLVNEIKKAKFKDCKKTELIDIFLRSGVELTGKVPDEILNQ